MAILDEVSLYEQAVEALTRGDLKQASGLCKQLMEREPASAQAHHLMSSLFKATGNYRKAFDYAAQASQLDDCVASYHMEQGQLLFTLGYFEQATESFKRVASLSPSDAEPLVWLGDCMKQLEQFELAHEWYQKAGGLSAHRSIACAQADCYHEAGDTDKAESLLLSMAGQYPQDAQLHYQLARLTLMRGDMERAGHLFAKAKRYGAAQESDFYLALLAMRAEDDKQAIDHLLELLKRNPIHQPALLLLGNIFLNLGEIAAAEKSFSHVLALSPTHLVAWQNLLQIATDDARLSDQMPKLKIAIEQAADPVPLKHMRSLYRGDVPPRAPGEYVSLVYDSLLLAFGDWIVANQEERHVQELTRTLRKCPEIEGKKYISLLDLGCNVGATARLLNDIAVIRVGVDISGQAVKVARRSKQYDVLYELDLIEYALASESTFDVITLGGALRWTGNLQLFFSALRNVMHNDSICAFITTKEPSTLAYTVQLDGRYQHSPAYIHDAATAEGLQITLQKDLIWLGDDATMVPKMITIVKKTTLH